MKLISITIQLSGQYTFGPSVNQFGKALALSCQSGYCPYAQLITILSNCSTGMHVIHSPHHVISIKCDVLSMLLHTTYLP